MRFPLVSGKWSVVSFVAGAVIVLAASAIPLGAQRAKDANATIVILDTAG